MKAGTQLGVFAAAALVAWTADALEISNRYSPLNRNRPTRPKTRYIVLHTTEGPSKGSLEEVHRYGETHYFIDPRGHVYRIIHRNKIATHAGRSMWNGLRNMDNYSIGIEVVGYHNRDIADAQYTALKELLQELQNLYRITDENVLCHAMVAYGAPNRWHRSSHRGRKRCGMLFAKRDVRLRLGLEKQPLYDPDVRAGRLKDADPYLSKVLYGSAREQDSAVTRFAAYDANVIAPGRSAWDIARDEYASAETLYELPGGKSVRGNEVTDWRKLPPGTKVALSKTQSMNTPDGFRIIGVDGNSAEEIAGDEAHSKTTVYFMPNGMIRCGHELSDRELTALKPNTKVLVGYTYGGYITAKRRAVDICGKRWNYPSTFYRLPGGEIRTGDQVNENSIPEKTLVFFRS